MLEKETVWEMIGREFSNIGKWLGSIGGGLLSAILVPIAIVVGLGLLILISVYGAKKICCKIWSTDKMCKGCFFGKGKKRKKADMEWEDKQHDVYLKLKRMETPQRKCMATTSL